MWPFKNSKPSKEKLIREYAHAIGKTWSDIPYITELLPDNFAAFRFIFSSYILGFVFHELEHGANERVPPHLLASAFPKSHELKKVSDVLIDPHDLWDLPEHIRMICGMKEFPDECSDLEVPTNILILGVYFIRLERMVEYIQKSISLCEKPSKWEAENILIASGVLLSGYIFKDAYSLTQYNPDSAAIAMDRAARLKEYSRSLYRAVSPISKKYT